MLYDIIIIGGGPAGMTAALYARRAGKNVLLLEKEGFGGQIAFSPRVENYPGVGSIAGAKLAENMLSQLLELDVETDVCEVNGILPEKDGYLLTTAEGEKYRARAVILAAGVKHRPLGVPGEEELLGRGISYCAVCDGSFYAGQDVAVAGGGDSALQEALMLSDICRTVYVIHRRESFRGEQARQERLFARSNVRVLAPARIQGFDAPEGELKGLYVRDEKAGETRTVPVEALFVAVGLMPELSAFGNLVPLSAGGYAMAGEDGRTPVPGIFVAGDCREKTVRQLTTAVADGACAALGACDYLDKL